LSSFRSLMKGCSLMSLWSFSFWSNTSELKSWMRLEKEEARKHSALVNFYIIRLPLWDSYIVVKIVVVRNTKQEKSGFRCGICSIPCKSKIRNDVNTMPPTIKTFPTYQSGAFSVPFSTPSTTLSVSSLTAVLGSFSYRDSSFGPTMTGVPYLSCRSCQWCTKWPFTLFSSSLLHHHVTSPLVFCRVGDPHRYDW
jgi:hypothetical protein